MREYAKVAPQFWIGPTGKRIRQLGADAQVIALYLLTSPHANMIGLYHLPVPYISADTGIPIEEASKALHSLTEAGFCGYDAYAEVVWVYEMARDQVGENLKANDKQCAGVANAYAQVPTNMYLAAFYERYRTAYHLSEKRLGSSSEAPSPDPCEAPSQPLESQEQEQEQEQEKDSAPNGAAQSDDCPRVRAEAYANTWNEHRGPLPRVREFTESRRRKIKTRIAQGVSLEAFAAVVKRCAATPFLIGNNDRGWQADFDWLIENDTNIARVMEGKYDNGGHSSGTTKGARTIAAARSAMAAVAHRAASDAGSIPASGAGSGDLGAVRGEVEPVRPEGYLLRA